MMLSPSSKRSLLLPQAPPFALRRGVRCSIANLWALIRGAHDLGQPFGPDGLQPAVASWQRQVDQIAARIDDALGFRLAELDQQIGALAGQAYSHEASLHALSDVLTQALTADHDEHTVAAADNRRQLRRTRDAIEVESQHLTLIGQEILRLASAKDHLRMAARDIADTWSRRCDELAALHRRGHHLRQFRTNRSELEPGRSLPRHRSCYEWANHDEH
jgi:hypothetical protein